MIFNLIIPIVTGLFFVLYIVYFILANPSHAASYRYFVVFLIAFGTFLMGRALQVVAGPFPLPLIIVNLRVFILCAVVSPLAMLTANTFKRRRAGKQEFIILCSCVLLGAIYVVFNSLGTRESFVLHRTAWLTLHDNLTPSARPPFYAREVTLAVQVLTGLMLLAFSLVKLIRLKAAKALRDYLADKNFLINAGILIFALSFIAGSLLMRWWIYYAASVVSALFIGASVLVDIREVHARYEKLVPFLKEDIVHGFALGDFPRLKIKETLRMLGKRAGMDTFAVAGLKGSALDIQKDIERLDVAMEILGSRLASTFEEDAFLLLPVSSEKIGMIVSLAGDPRGGEAAFIEALEGAQAEMAQRTGRSVRIGVGRTCAGVDELKTSFSEALNALERAERLEGNGIVHANDLGGPSGKSAKYPVREKERLLSAVKLGDVSGSRAALDEFMAGFEPFIGANPGILKVRLYELSGSLIDSAILGGGDEERLNDLVAKCFDDINHIQDPAEARSWLGGVVERIAQNIGSAHEKRSRTIVEKAKKVIQNSYARQIGYKDVAKEVFISPSYFLSLFKKETGITFTDYLTDLRIQKAKELLKSTEKSVTEISFEVGFNNPNYFSNTFKRAAGVTAKDYRKGR